MESLLNDPFNDPTNLGIKKIVDCKIGQDGQAIYHVKWNMTWEPAENLTGCQHLVDEFWKRISRLKSSGIASSCGKNGLQGGLKPDGIAMEQAGLCTRAPSSYQRLMSDSLGNSTQISSTTNFPCTVSSHSQLDLQAINHQLQQWQRSADYTATQNSSTQSKPASGNSSPVVKGSKSKGTPVKGPKRRRESEDFVGNEICVDSTTWEPLALSKVKQEAIMQKHNENDLTLAGGDKSDLDSVKAFNCPSCDKKYDNWTNPYVRVAFLCLICSKEQKSKSYWKMHYESHSDVKSYECPVCKMAFNFKNSMRRHMKNIHGGDVD